MQTEDRRIVAHDEALIQQALGSDRTFDQLPELGGRHRGTEGKGLDGQGFVRIRFWHQEWVGVEGLDDGHYAQAGVIRKISKRVRLLGGSLTLLGLRRVLGEVVEAGALGLGFALG